MPASRFNKGPSRFSHKTRPHFKKHSFNSRGGRPAQKRVQQSFSDISKFVNKAVIIEEAPVFVPEHKFADFLIDSRLKQNIIQKGYITPTPIQDRAIPHVLRGEDVVGIANTGTGKTAAFLIPLVNKILTVKGQRVLIMVPTRELALQINDELKGFAKGLGIYGVVCVGGANINPQIADLRRKPAIVIGTPGRLKDLLEPARSTWATSTPRSSTRPTACSTWASSPTCEKFYRSCLRRATRSFSPPHSAPKSSA